MNSAETELHDWAKIDKTVVGPPPVSCDRISSIAEKQLTHSNLKRVHASGSNNCGCSFSRCIVTDEFTPGVLPRPVLVNNLDNKVLRRDNQSQPNLLDALVNKIYCFLNSHVRVVQLVHKRQTEV
uniref:Uncharacterized protein n=1 Tax=Zea mays TaxID=4577 RepID=C0PG22_MAIZE|nr:unknown [Zea mays]